MQMSSTPVASAAHEGVRGVSPFSDATIAFAVDVSGSTFGPALAAEKRFIRYVSDMLSPRSRALSRILPWDDKAYATLDLASVDQLEDAGGTDPGAILADPRHKAVLRESSLWFLMTDGLIYKDLRVKFAQDVASNGVHGTSCVVVIFGDPGKGPAACDISVGISVFAVAPDCAFLFCNETNGDLRILQTKGAFNVLLKGMPHPVFDASSRWDSLPQMSLASLAAVQIPTPHRLRPDQIALQDSLVISMEDLFGNRLSPEQVSTVLDNNDNLHTIIMTSGTRDQQERFQSWIQEQTIEPDEPLFKPRPDREGKAQSLFRELGDIVRRGQGSAVPDALRARLRKAHHANMESFIRDVDKKARKVNERNMLISSAESSVATPVCNSDFLSSPTEVITRSPTEVATRSQPITLEAAASPPSTPDRVGQLRRMLQSWGSRRQKPLPKGQGDEALPKGQGDEDLPEKHEDEPIWGSWNADISDRSLLGLLYTSGFHATGGSFRGTCPLCHASDMTMAWLFRVPVPGGELTPRSSISSPTPNFPSQGSCVRLSFPLAMGLWPETAGVLTVPPPAPTAAAGKCRAVAPSAHQMAPPALVCEPCSVFFARGGASEHGVAAALPLVRYKHNRDAVDRTLRVVFEDRFSDAHLPEVFLSVLLMAASSLASPSPSAGDGAGSHRLSTAVDIGTGAAATREQSMFRAAVEWTARDLLKTALTVHELSESFCRKGEVPARECVLGSVLVDAFVDPAFLSGSFGTEGKPLLQYPLAGFVVILQAAAIAGVEPQWRQQVALQRLLVLLCERALETLAGEQVLQDVLGASQVGGPVTISSLQSTRLLGVQNYNLMRKAEEFRILDDPSLTWVTREITAFLQGLLRTMLAGPRLSAWDTFLKARSGGEETHMDGTR
ncbi:hypothetical protein GGTG_10890 [Gaeumannomyces tritici R3-111a-1]|uniref:VWFA domain-containing protein n=1 Tax=Gaeumannomyces tritici (strain R3-111a-1) TaxID=644352 RepID=J3PBL8_GAET3|nr:hypothetical protein GGTG_10890 [Gaeumannomyces tritici R3-111a-1]EJT71635.1 hypothetical protein GGTG_10890 [Gaeumannomyces tritici R3-111a-1]